MWRAIDGEPIGKLEGNYDSAASLAFSPDGTHLTVGNEQGQIEIWQVRDRTPLLKMETAQGGRILGLAYSSDGSRLASGARDGTIGLWSANDGKLLSSLTGHSTLACDLAFSPDGTLLATGSWDGTIRLWGVH